MLALVCLKHFDMLYFHFHPVEVFKFFLQISSSTHALFGSMLFEFQIFWDFPVIFQLLISSFIPLELKNTLNDFVLLIY
jgi:hypothetical protein